MIPLPPDQQTLSPSPPSIAGSLPRWRLAAPLLAVSLAFQWWLFSSHVRRDVAPVPAVYYEQLASLAVAYEGYEQARSEGALEALRGVMASEHPLGLLLPTGGWAVFLASGPSRLGALAVNFAVYALMQVVVVLVLRRLAGGPAALLGWGLTWALRAAYLPAGGIADFRADFAALCLFTAWLGLALRGGAFESPRWSALAGLAAGACVWARFLTIVYLAVILAAFAAVNLARRAASETERRQALARCRGAAVCGLLMIALSAPALWAQRAGIDAHYFKGILGPLRGVRAQVVGADRPWGNLVFYPRSLQEHAGPIVWALALGLAVLLALEVVRRRGSWTDTTRASAWLLFLAFVVPLALLTLLTSKSLVAGGILLGPLLWAIPLAGTWWCRSRAVGPAGEALAWAAAILIATAGAIVQYRAWHRPLPLDPAEVAGAFALYDAVERDGRERGLSAPVVSVDHVSDGLNALAVNVGTYERQGKLLHARHGLGSSIGDIAEGEVLARAQESDFLILTVSGGRVLYPADRSLAAARPALRAYCGESMRSRGRFRTPGREVELFGRP